MLLFNHFSLDGNSLHCVLGVTILGNTYDITVDGSVSRLYTVDWNIECIDPECW